MSNIPEEIKVLIKDSVDVQALLQHLGFMIFRSTPSELRAPCIIHGGDNPTGFSMRLSTKKWKCFTNKCELDPTGRADNDVISLVMKVVGLPFIEALQYLVDFSGLGFDLRNTEFQVSPEFYQKRDIDRFVKRTTRIISPPRPSSNLDEGQIISYKNNRDDYFNKEGFLSSTLDVFDVGSTVSRYGFPSASIPIRDDLGNLVGLSLRRTDSDNEPRYDIGFKFEKDKVLYNLHAARKISENFIIIVEGFKACWSVYEAGFPNVVACMGSVITLGQVKLLELIPPTKFILMLDGDEAGQLGMISSQLMLEKLAGNNLISAYLPEGESPDSLTRKELKEFLDMYIALI